MHERDMGKVRRGGERERERERKRDTGLPAYSDTGYSDTVRTSSLRVTLF